MQSFRFRSRVIAKVLNENINKFSVIKLASASALLQQKDTADRFVTGQCRQIGQKAAVLATFILVKRKVFECA